jgi:glycosidase
MSSQKRSDAFTTPEWVKHAVFYQIFPERFDNGDPERDPENVQPWGTTPTPGNFMGGDLRGIINRLDYLSELGVTALYLNPIFQASSNHKYNTYDYYRIDPHFGDLATFHELLHEAHQRNMRVILDGVFNHCGRGFFAFVDILENGNESPYLKWFHIKRLPIHPYTDMYPANYSGWWNLRSLPKFNTEHDPVRRYLFDVARYWIEQGADGWRLDVPNEIEDHAFWRDFRRVVKQAKPDAYIVGEIWTDATPWLDGTQFDAVMNYVWRDLCRDYFAYEQIPTDAFARAIEILLRRYPNEATLAQLNLFGSHDTARFLTEVGGDVRKLFAPILFQMTFPGAPCIYYGDEIGLRGGKDPQCRGCFPWQQDLWNQPLHIWVRRCIAIRHAHAALRTGEYHTLLAQNEPPLYAFVRWNNEEQLVVVLNPGEQSATWKLALKDLPLAATRNMRDVLSDTAYTASDDSIEMTVAARSGLVLTHA